MIVINKNIYILPFAWMVFFVAGLSPAKAQVTISGANCVTAGTVYLYTINSKWDSAFKSQLCVNGGVIMVDSPCNCVFGSGFSVAKIKWNSNTDKGVINILSPGGISSFNISIVQSFSPGTIDSVNSVQVLDSISLPAAIQCKAASGGSCSPSFTYQWQQSDNSTQWKSIDGANQQNLSIGYALKKTMFYRRKAIEKISGSIDYSNAAIVIINYYSKH
jgi:hypothetical protein